MKTLRSWAVVLARLVLGGLFLYAGVMKGLDVRQFADDIANYHIVPAALVPLCAATLPGIELAVGAALLLGLWTRGAALVVAAMMAVFLSALLSTFARGIDLTCGCFGGSGGAPADELTVVRDVVLLSSALLIVFFADGRLALDGRRAQPSRSTSQ